MFVRWINDPDVRRGLSIDTPLSLPQEEKWFENNLQSPIEVQPLAIEAQYDEDWQLIGNIGLMDLDWHARSAEIGIFIGEKHYWDQGFGKEAMELMLEHSFVTYNLHRIFLRVYDTNSRAIRCYEKIGFTHEGRMREAHFENGRYTDVLLMSILRPEWKSPHLT
jgi:RimJ/RimL family protein N-acetyltransferase